MGHPPKAGAFGRSPGSREDPWAFFGYFLSQQKVTPRRGGETSQKVFKTRQDCEGPDWRVAVKENVPILNKRNNPQKEAQAHQSLPLRGRWFSNENRREISQRKVTQRAYFPLGRHVQEAALRACLEGQTDKPASAWRSPRLGIGQSRSGRGLSLRTDTKKGGNTPSFFSAILLAAALVEGYCLMPEYFARYGGRPGAVRPGPGPD